MEKVYIEIRGTECNSLFMTVGPFNSLTEAEDYMEEQGEFPEDLEAQFKIRKE